MPAKHEPTPETRAQVAALRSYGHPVDDIADFLEISDDTLRLYYKRELATAQIIANAEVARKLYNRATKKDDIAAQIFWLKTRARWRTQDVETMADQNDAMRKELAELRGQLDEKNKKDY